MKKIITIALLLCVFDSFSYAEVVNESRAREVAARFFFGDFATKSDVQSLNMVWDGTNRSSGTKSSNSDDFEFINPSFYAFNRLGGGFVFISGDDSVEPIIGYSLDGEVNPDNMPPAFLWWMDGVKKTIDSKRLARTIPSYEVSLAWKNVMTRATSGQGSYYNGVGGKQLNTPQWTQSDPFHNACPKDSSGDDNCPCGCVATAMSELMRYYEWPSEPADLTIPGYTDQQGHVIASRDLTDRVYDFASMPMETEYYYHKRYSLELGNAIAQLLADVGCAVQMDYDDDGSGASTEDIVYAMGTYFKFNKNAKVRYRDFYSLSEWESMMIKSINDGHPMLAAGNSATGGHQFIVDGYDGNHLMRFNFGWGNYLELATKYQYNGYWAVGMNEYAKKFSIILDEYPDPTATSEFSDPELYFSADTSASCRGLSLVNGILAKNQKCSLSVKGIATSGPVNFNGYLKLGLEDKSGTISSGITTSSFSATFETGYIYSYSNWSFTVTRDFQLGDKVVLLYRNSSNDPWSRVLSCKNGSAICEYPLVQYAFIDIPNVCQRGDEVELSIKNAPYIWYNSASWYVLPPESDTETQATFSSPGYQSLARNSYKFESTGTYRIRVVVRDPFTGSIIDNISTKVTVY